MANASTKDDRIARYTRWIIRRPWWVLGAGILTTVLAGAGARNLGLSTDYRTYFSEDNPDLLAYEQVENIYTRNDMRQSSSPVFLSKAARKLASSLSLRTKSRSSWSAGEEALPKSR